MIATKSSVTHNERPAGQDHYKAWLSGLILLYHHARVPVAVMLVLGRFALCEMFGGVSSNLETAISEQVQRLVELAPTLSSGDARLAKLVEASFQQARQKSISGDAVLENRAAILALGIVIGHERLAQPAGLSDAKLIRAASAVRRNASLRGRADWARHYFLSAALAVLENPSFSDAAGAMKEVLDSRKGGSGFSFGDLMADRAGVLFAGAGTRDEAAARAMQARLATGFIVDNFFPAAADLPEHISREQLLADYGGVGGARYREISDGIDRRLSQCEGLK
jgi:uncharacterized protein YfiM (DUF2279 family)